MRVSFIISFIFLLKEISMKSFDIIYLFICDGLNAKARFEVSAVNSEEG